MIEPRIDKLLATTLISGETPSRYGLAMAAARRARQINSHYHQIGEGIGFTDGPPPLVESRSKNYLTMAMEEMVGKKLVFSYADSAAT